jgi:hypothetical protein
VASLKVQNFTDKDSNFARKGPPESKNAKKEEKVLSRPWLFGGPGSF